MSADDRAFVSFSLIIISFLWFFSHYNFAQCFGTGKPWQCLFEKIIIVYFFLVKTKQIFKMVVAPEYSRGISIGCLESG